MERCAAERVAALVEIGRTAGYVDAVLLIFIARAACDCWIACRKRQTSSVVHSTPRNHGGDVEDTLVILHAANAIGLHTEVRFDDITVAAHDLDDDERRKHACRSDTEQRDKRCGRRAKWVRQVRLRGG